MNKQASEMLPPPAIGIPTASLPVLNESSNEQPEETVESSDDVVITLFNRFDERSMDKSVTMKSIPEDSIADDSFYQKINDEDFKVEPVNESDGSVFFKVEAPLFEEDFSNEQLLSYIEQLCNNLKNVERSAKKQKSRRRSREKTIVKMANVLQGQKDTVQQLRAKVDELKSEVRMKEAESSLSDQRLQNTMKDLKDAEKEIKSLNKHRYRQDVSNGDLHTQIASKDRAQHTTLTRKRQRTALKGVAMVLLCVSSLTAMCAVIGCKMTSSKTIWCHQDCDMFSSLRAYRHHFASQVKEAEMRQIALGAVAPASKRRNLLDLYANVIMESTTSSVAQNCFQRKIIA